ncbi:hypothetical protein ACROYT_G005120 [Oculina patagonica]
MSNPAPQKRKRAYRHRVTCTECKDAHAHARTKHIGKKVKFTVPRAPNQSQLGFTGGDETITNMLKCSKIDAENVGSDLQNDSSSDIVDSSDAALDNSEIMAVQVNNAAQRAPATSEFMDVCVTDESEILEKVSIDNSVPEKSVIMDNGAPDKSGIVDGGHNSSLDANAYSATCQKSSDIVEDPQQPILKFYDPKKSASESFSRDFNPAWYKRYPWLSFNLETKKACCYPCQKYLNAHDFTFDNWKKIERLTKHHKSENHQTAMAKWINSRENKKRSTSILSKLQESHKQYVKENRDYLKVITECLIFTAQQNIAQRGHGEQRDSLSDSSDVNRGNFLELIHLRCKDMAGG